jgi:sigma-B regulation protein RsbU (phosphoserine phosphatase)
MQDSDIDIAAKVHYSFLPETYSNNIIDISVKAQPYSKIGGDYCSILPIDANRVILCMCDTVGHGIAAALYAARVNTFVLTHCLQHENPCKLLDSLNEFLCQRLEGIGIYTTFCTIFLDSEQREMEVAGAAHPPVLYYHAEKGEYELIPSETTFLGIQHPLLISCSAHRKKLNPGDKIVLYTDGLIELKSPLGEFFGTEGLIEFTKIHHALDSEMFNKRLFEEVINNRDRKIIDDILLMTITIK